MLLTKRVITYLSLIAEFEMAWQFENVTHQLVRHFRYYKFDFTFGDEMELTRLYHHLQARGNVIRVIGVK